MIDFRKEAMRAVKSPPGTKCDFSKTLKELQVESEANQLRAKKQREVLYK